MNLNYLGKSQGFMPNSSAINFGASTSTFGQASSNNSSPNFGASTPTFGQSPTNSSSPNFRQPSFGQSSYVFSPIQPPNVFQTPNTSRLWTGTTSQNHVEGRNLFGQQQQTPSLFINQTKSTFGSEPTRSPTGPFGQQPQQQTGSSFLKPINLFGSFEQRSGTPSKFSPVAGSDILQKQGYTQSIKTRLQCYSCMKEYEDKSLEELRFEDYSSDRKGPKAQIGFGGISTSPFSQSDKQGQLPNSFGQTTSFLGASNTLFGKSNTLKTSTDFKASPPASNPFSLNQNSKPFSPNLFGTTTTTQAPSNFGALFGQSNAEKAATGLFSKPLQPIEKTASNLFPKPLQPGVSGDFSWTQPTTVSNLFQASKPNTDFGLFGQNTPPEQKCQYNLGKISQPALTQPTPSIFASGIQTQPSLVKSVGDGNSTCFNFQLPAPQPVTVPLQPPAQIFPPKYDEEPKLNLTTTDIFPIVSESSLDLVHSEPKTPSPNFLPSVGTIRRYEQDKLETFPNKITVHPPKPKRGLHYRDDFFGSIPPVSEPFVNFSIKGFDTPDPGTRTIFNTYGSEVLQAAEESLQSNELRGSEESCNRTSEEQNPELDSHVDDNEVTIAEESSTDSSSAAEDNADNPSGVILTKPQYYMYPAQEELHRYINDDGKCIVQGLTVGRKGYGNVYFPEAIDISNMNLDDVVHFRHRELIVYPDEKARPSVGEGLNRPAQVTLDGVYPRVKGEKTQIKNLDEILQSHFTKRLVEISRKHGCSFVEYRPQTGSWVFRVKHFSRYVFSEEEGGAEEAKQKERK